MKELNLKDEFDYEWESLVDKKAVKDITGWNSSFGPEIIERKNGKSSLVKFSILIDNPDTKVYLVGSFNAWGKESLSEYELKHDKYSVFASIETSKIKHGDGYKFLVKQNIDKINSATVKEKNLHINPEMYMQDPAGVYFDDAGNAILWDFDDPSVYKQKYPLVDNFKRSIKIVQTDLPGMIVHFADKKGVIGRDIDTKNYYKFIADSGILHYIKELGFNTIQFLPFAQSIDGDNWKYRYLVPYQFAIQKNWGTPDDFSYMIDKCHEAGIAVIGDFIISHFPFKDFSVFGSSSDYSGVHHFISRHNSRLYMKEETPWGTMRMDYDNEYVRKFIISSCLHFMKNYRIDGFRIDNVDGILRFGTAGQGEERPSGRRFLQDLVKTIYEYNPSAMINLESHYFYGDNAKMLVSSQNRNDKAIGATGYNSSRLTYFFHTDYMLKTIDKVSAWKFKHIIDEKEWGKSNSTIADFHNHDAAAGLMEERATGSYAYDAMCGKKPENHFHSQGKIKVMEAIISFMCEGRTLDLIQTFLLQKGTFEHDSSIRWDLTFTECNRNTLMYKKAVNDVMDAPAFWPINVRNRKVMNVDDKNKIIVTKRSGKNSKGVMEEYLIIINLSNWNHHNYKVGVEDKAGYLVVFNSDEFRYAGTGMSSLPTQFKNYQSSSFEFFDREIVIPFIAPYQVVVVKKQ